MIFISGNAEHTDIYPQRSSAGGSLSSRPKKAPLVGNPAKTPYKPWPALWSLVVGFFMILVDGNIVTIALPHMLQERLPAGVCGAAAYYRPYG
mgnify:CR=1 FL=1